MSEEKKVEYNNGSNEFVDYFLVDVIGTANENFNTDDQSLMPATISVNGTIYSGYIIGGAVWCDLSIKYTESTAVNSDIAQGMKKYFTGIKNTHYTPEALKESKEKGIQPAYLHMLVKTTMPNERTINKLWRFKACEVEGVSLGYLN